MSLSPYPVGIPGLIVLLLGGIAFAGSLIAARRRRGPPDAGQSRRSRRSWLGIAIQGLGFLVVGVGQFRIVRDPLWAPGLLEAAAIAALTGGALWLFVAATRVMGAAWSLEARTRSDHRLATSGPFAYVRHPIYSGMALFLFALAIAYGHEAQLLAGVPLFMLGPGCTYATRNGCCAAEFGAAYDAWAEQTRRFVPGL